MTNDDAQSDTPAPPAALAPLAVTALEDFKMDPFLDDIRADADRPVAVRHGDRRDGGRGSFVHCRIGDAVARHSGPGGGHDAGNSDGGRREMPRKTVAPASPVAGPYDIERRWRVPFEPAVRRELYERVVPAAWPLVTRMVTGYGAGGRLYMERDVARVLWPVAAHMAYAVTTDADQLAFIEATGGVPERFDPVPLWFLHGCPLCDLIACRRHRRPRPHTEHWTRHLFTHRLQEGLSWAFSRQDPYDRRLGMPRRSGRLSLKYARSRPSPLRGMVGTAPLSRAA